MHFDGEPFEIKGPIKIDFEYLYLKKDNKIQFQCLQN